LHSVGCAREGFSEDDFFVEPSSGDVKIAFDDGLHSVRDIRFTAPELIVGGNEGYGAVASEMFSVYIMVFMLLTSNHPFEGKEWLSKPYISNEDAFGLYGTPVFIFEADNDANRPSDGIQSSVKEMWTQFPEYIKNLFQVVFGKESIKNPLSRISDLELLEVLAHFSCDIIRCKCGNEMIYNGDTTVVCPLCNRPTEIKNKIELSSYSVPAVMGTVIYRGQINGVATGEFSLEKLFLVVARPDNSGELGLKNVSNEIFSVTTASGQKLPLVPQNPVPLGAGAGLVIDVDGCEVKLSRN
jgi:serine/threonine protein kinase